MTLNLDMDTDYQKVFDFDLEETAKKVIEGALDHENCPYEAEVNLVLTDNEEIRRTNREFRDIDRETDVLSFPMLEYDRPGDFSHAEEDESCFNPDTGELILGDIMISVPKLKEQAEAYGHSQLREYAFLIAHSLLHLMGYDHMEPEEAVLMESRQREILEDLGITR
ncbi:MAG TPA: rRNA maturation RNase YbeY [Candidatus Blautia avicola]|uniref:Endoribonuclease YbeY n=1 Tax=Candidatus Blautia avicola TaxID=2838483 RepID=A0A9D2TVT2_9FIRM|nr:rRNA maturation RNase YbeY [Candidatus Blautia avicola]